MTVIKLIPSAIGTSLRGFLASSHEDAIISKLAKRLLRKHHLLDNTHPANAKKQREAPLITPANPKCQKLFPLLTQFLTSAKQKP